LHHQAEIHFSKFLSIFSLVVMRTLTCRGPLLCKTGSELDMSKFQLQELAAGME
jgi:hypothetical protein